MDNLIPPPNASPEEIQAWNNMMDTMVTFIKASTHLMNTITQKVKYSGARGVPGNMFNMGGCEPECDICRPKPQCGVCSWDRPSVSQPASPVRASLVDTPTPPSPPLPDTPASPSPEMTIPPAAPENSEAAPENSEAAPENSEAAPENSEAAPEEHAEVEGDEGAAEIAGEIAENPDEEAQDVPPPALPESAEVLPVITEVPAAAQVAPDAGDTQCICAAVRAKRMREQEEKDGAITPDEEQPPQEPIVERLCGCGATDGNQAAMFQEMMLKLANAQGEINQLHEEMARLQRMDTSRRTGPHGGPNPAALYREIMRDTPSFRAPFGDRQSDSIAPNVRRRLFQTNASGASSGDRPPSDVSGNRSPDSVPCRLFPNNRTNRTADSSRGYSRAGASSMERPAPTEPPNRIPGLIPRRLFDTSEPLDVTAEGAYEPPSPPSVQRLPAADPADRIPRHVVQRLFQTNTSSQEFESFGSPGMDLSSIPGGGGPLPPGFTGCVPCDLDRAPSSLGTLGISPIPPIPGAMKRQLQSPQQQRSPGSPGLPSMHSTPRADRTQASLNRPISRQYVGGVQAPCRRFAGISGRSQAFRSLASNIEDSSVPSDSGGWEQQNEQQQQSQQQFQSLGGTLQSSRYYSPPRRMEVSRPRPQSSSAYPSPGVREQRSEQQQQQQQYQSLNDSLQSTIYNSPPRRLEICTPPPQSSSCKPECAGNRSQL